MSRRIRPRPFTALYGVLLVAANAWIVWCAYVAFAGGTLPIPGVDAETRGALSPGLVWLLVGIPVMSALARWVAVAVTAALRPLATAIRRARHERTRSR